MPSLSRWPVFVPPIAVGGLVLGLSLHAATTIYDIRHWDTVYDVAPEVAANRNGLADLALSLFAQLDLTISCLAIVGLLLSMPGLVRGRTWAHATACTLIAPFALCCGLLLVEGRGSLHGDLDDPDNIAPGRTHAPAWVLVSDTVGPPLLVSGAFVALILLLLPPVFRRFHLSHQEPGGQHFTARKPPGA